MRKGRIISVAVLCVSLSAFGIQPCGAEEPGGPAHAGFPAYSREDVVRVCLSEYGMGNSSVLDCLAQDQKVRTSLARKWADIADSDRTSCLVRLADLHANSYSHLDACVRSAQKAKDAPAPE